MGWENRWDGKLEWGYMCPLPKLIVICVNHKRSSKVKHKKEVHYCKARLLLA